MTAFRRFVVILIALALLAGCKAPSAEAAPTDSAPPPEQEPAAQSALLPSEDSAADSVAAPETQPEVDSAQSAPPATQPNLPASSAPQSSDAPQAESSGASAPAPQPARATKDTWVLPAGYEELDDDPYAQAAQEMLDGINAIREKYGLPALRRSGILDCSATLRAMDLDTSTEEQFYAHLRPDNSRWSTAFDELGITFWTSRGENLGMVKFNNHAEDWQMMTDAWEDSPDHFENIVTESFTDIGIGIYRNRFGRYFICTHFASFA